MLIFEICSILALLVIFCLSVFSFYLIFFYFSPRRWLVLLVIFSFSQNNLILVSILFAFRGFQAHPEQFRFNFALFNLQPPIIINCVIPKKKKKYYIRLVFPFIEIPATENFIVEQQNITIKTFLVYRNVVMSFGLIVIYNRQN